jgi:hypothetical protein
MIKMTVLDSPLYQWDKGRKILLELEEGERVTHVHYSNGMVAEVTEVDGVLVAPIPNILLQSCHNIGVYAVVTDEDCMKTRHDRTFLIRPKVKPADYVYTEEEIYTIETAVEKALQKAINKITTIHFT